MVFVWFFLSLFIDLQPLRSLFTHKTYRSTPRVSQTKSSLWGSLWKTSHFSFAVDSSRVRFVRANRDYGTYILRVDEPYISTKKRSRRDIYKRPRPIETTDCRKYKRNEWTKTRRFENTNIFFIRGQRYIPRCLWLFAWYTPPAVNPEERGKTFTYTRKCTKKVKENSRLIDTSW